MQVAIQWYIDNLSLPSYINFTLKLVIQDIGGYTCHYCLPRIIHNDDIGLRNARSITAASLESGYIGLVQRGYYLVRPGENIYKLAMMISLTTIHVHHQGFFCHSCPHIFRISLRFVPLLDIGIATLCGGNRNHCLSNDKAHIPQQST
jgi:hypothetical protein